MNTISTPLPAQAEASDELELCISCLKTNSPGTHFCKHCGTPLTSFAAAAPFESMFAEGDFWRKALQKGQGNKRRRMLALLFLVIMGVGLLLGFWVPR